MISLGNRGVIHSICLGLFLGLLLLPATAAEKEGMPDLCQIEQTCLPTSTSNLIVWFGLHGYPKLIAPGDDAADGYIHTVHRVMAATDARFDWGTRLDMVTVGIKKYIEDAGYSCDVEFRGMGKTPFTQDWLTDNDNNNQGFILLLDYCFYDPDNKIFTNAWDAGHAVTLVNAEQDMILVHDPAHMEDQTGRKILTPEVLKEGTWRSKKGDAPVAGLMLLSGSLLGAPPNAGVMLIGAVCITMHPIQDAVASGTPDSAGGANATVGGTDTSSTSPATPAEPVSTTKSWTEWFFNMLFSK